MRISMFNRDVHQTLSVINSAAVSLKIINASLIVFLTIRLVLSGCNFVLLLNYRNIEYRIGKFKKLSDYWILDQSLNLSEYKI
jgi:hypothetical protein